MGDEKEFLGYIYQNVKMAQENIARIIDEIGEENSLSILLKEQLKDYKKVIISIKNMLETRNSKVSDISIFSKLVTYMSIKINISDLDDIQKITNKIIQNCEVSILDLEKKITEYRIKSKVVLNLANRLIDIEKNNILRLKCMGIT